MHATDSGIFAPIHLVKYDAEKSKILYYIWSQRVRSGQFSHGDMDELICFSFT